jgi:hypothetical protein
VYFDRQKDIAGRPALEKEKQDLLAKEKKAAEDKDKKAEDEKSDAKKKPDQKKKPPKNDADSGRAIAGGAL